MLMGKTEKKGQFQKHFEWLFPNLKKHKKMKKEKWECNIIASNQSQKSKFAPPNSLNPNFERKQQNISTQPEK